MESSKMTSNRLAPMAVLSVVFACAADGAFSAELAKTTPDFCIVVQQRIEGTALVADAVEHPTYASFQESKSEVKPLRVEQFVEYRDAATKSDPLRISCKVKTADQLNEIYGDGTAKGSGTCEAIHREIASAVAAGLPVESLKISPSQITFEPDYIKYMGSQWVSPYQYVYRDGAALHLKSKALYVAWTDIRFKLAPDRFRGTHYCHLIAPEYLARLLTGAEQAPSRVEE